ncbi:RING-H2 finger protein ATL29-like [Primulina huaijiensis]|uniref:RING-H2 finger protein ATL29-like n=1 Tax=Primulina huaijiensis TaxID=1492673 RepID=UPI003CC77C98
MATGSVQPSPPLSSPPVPLLPPEYTTPPIIIILTIILLLFFFVGFFSIYFCRCLMQNLFYTWHIRHSPSRNPAAGHITSTSPGLDPVIIQSFPSFSYSSVKDYRREKYGLECAICLIEFVDSDILRLLTSCCHVFHQECIDLWLESHKTCPVCRRNLDSPIHSPVKSPSHPYSNAHDDTGAASESSQDCLSITIDEESQDETRDGGKIERIASQNGNLQHFYRSNSTGHNSLVENKEEEKGDHKFTLRLPENVKSNVIKGHNSSISWSTFGDYKAKVSTSGISKSST